MEHITALFLFPEVYEFSFTEWDTDDVTFWLEANGLEEFMKGFKGKL